jgi:hypothetical protein
LTQLGRPESEDDLYLARGDEVEPYRPLLQGDVFSEVFIPGVEIVHEFAVVASHPCSMRRGAVLRERLQLLPVTTYPHVPLDDWPVGHFRVFPLPSLDPARSGHHFAAIYEEVGMVRSSELTPHRRVATLTERGILLFQQRQIFNGSRADISLSTLAKASAAVLAEAELLEDWNAALAAARCEAGEDLLDVLPDEAAAFDAFLSAPASAGSESLRDMLRTEHLRPAVRRAVRAEIARRVAALAL